MKGVSKEVGQLRTKDEGLTHESMVIRLRI